MSKVEFKTQVLVPVSGTSKRSGKPYSFNKQVGYLHQEGKPYPSEVEVSLDAGQQAYDLGFYDVHATPYVDRFKSVGFTLKLVKAK